MGPTCQSYMTQIGIQQLRNITKKLIPRVDVLMLWDFFTKMLRSTCCVILPNGEAGVNPVSTAVNFFLDVLLIHSANEQKMM